MKNEVYILETLRLSLTEFEPVTVEIWHQLMNNKEVVQTTLSLPFPCSLDDARNWQEKQLKKIAEGNLLRWAIVKKETGDTIGNIKLVINPLFESAELGYWLGKDYWGRGYAFEAAKQIVDFAFTTLKLNRLEAYAMDHNTSSEKILFKLGFLKEGLLRKSIKRWGEFIDVKSYGLLHTDWKP